MKFESPGIKTVDVYLPIRYTKKHPKEREEKRDAKEGDPADRLPSGSGVMVNPPSVGSKGNTLSNPADQLLNLF